MKVDLRADLLAPGPVVVVPTALAVEVGFKAAALLQRLHDRARLAGQEEGWLEGTIAEWHQDHFPDWSPSAIKRIFKRLAAKGWVEAIDLDEPGRWAWRISPERAIETELSTGAAIPPRSPEDIAVALESFGVGRNDSDERPAQEA